MNLIYDPLLHLQLLANKLEPYQLICQLSDFELKPFRDAARGRSEWSLSIQVRAKLVISLLVEYVNTDTVIMLDRSGHP